MDASSSSNSALARQRLASATAQASRFLKEPDLDFANNALPKLGVFPFNIQTAPLSQQALRNSLVEKSKRLAQLSASTPNNPAYLIFVDNDFSALNEERRKLCREALEAWQLRQQQLDREPSDLAKEDGVFNFIKQALKRQQLISAEGEISLNEWLTRFANAQESSFEFIEQFGCPEPKQFDYKATTPWYITLLDGICDKRMPTNRAVWLIKFSMLVNLRERIYMAPIGWTKNMLDWLGKLLDKMGQGMEAENRWKRGASLVRWMFEDGLLKVQDLFAELLRIWRAAFGVHAPTRTSTGGGVTAPGRGMMASMDANRLYSERVQVLVATEVVSYTKDAIRLGFAKEFHDCAKQILPSVANASVRPLFTLTLALCRAEMEEDVLQREIWREDYVQLVWELERIKYTVEEEAELGREVWRAVRESGFAPFSPTACNALVEWCSSKEEGGDEDDQEERVQLVCFALLLLPNNRAGISLDDLARCPALLAEFLSRRNPSEAPHSPSCFALASRLVDAKFEIAAADLVDELSKVFPPIARVRLVAWLLGKSRNCTVNLALLPLMENSLLVRRILLKAEDCELRRAIAARCKTMPEHEAKRLSDLLLISSASAAAAAGVGGIGGGGATGGATYNTMPFMGLPVTPQQPLMYSTSLGGGGGARKRQRHGLDFSDLGDDVNSPLGAATTTPAASTMATTTATAAASLIPSALLCAPPGFASEQARYEFGASKLGSEKLERIVAECQQAAAMQEGERVFSLAVLLRDLTCTRAWMHSNEEKKIMFNAMAAGNSQEHVEQAICFGLVTLDEVLLEWIAKKHVPSNSGAEMAVLSASHGLVRQQWKQLLCYKSPSATAFRLINHFLLFAKSRAEQFAALYCAVAREWISQGPGAPWLRDTKKFPEEARELLRRGRTTSAEDAWSAHWCTLARYTWFAHYRDADMLKTGLAFAMEQGDCNANAVASIIKAWDMQDQAVVRLETSALNSSSINVLARLLTVVAANVGDAAKPGSNSSSSSSKESEAQQVRKRICAREEEELVDDGENCSSFLSAAALFHAPLGTLTPSDALQKLKQRLMMVLDGAKNPLMGEEDRRILVELVRQALPLHQSDTASFDYLSQAWRVLLLLPFDGGKHWGSIARKALREEAPKERSGTENLVYVQRGPGEDGNDSACFVDAWLVLQCPHDTRANRTFLRPPPPVISAESSKPAMVEATPSL